VQAFYATQLERVEGKGRKRKVIKTPAKAAAIIRVLRLLLQAGRLLGYSLHEGQNPAAKPGISYERQREPVVWTPEQVRHMAADAEGWHSMAIAILLNEWIGQREADVLALTPWKVEADALRIRQEKTRRVVLLPVHLVPHLVERLRAERERVGAVVSTEYLLLHEGTGKEWNAHTFRHVFAEIRERAATPSPEQIEAGAVAMPSCADLRFMELRHTAVTRLDEAGVDALGIAGITGHSSKTVVDMLEKYYLTRTSKAAEGGVQEAAGGGGRRVIGMEAGGARNSRGTRV
jgi:integrase